MKNSIIQKNGEKEFPIHYTLYIIDFADEDFHHGNIKNKWKNLTHLTFNENSSVRKTLDALVKEFEKKNNKDMLLIKNYLFELFSALSDFAENFARSFANSLANSKQQKPVDPKMAYYVSICQKAKKYIEKNLNQQISLDDISNHAYLSKFRFAHIFRQFTGYSPINYLLTKRIEYSKRLLLGTEKTITEISNLSGFSDIHYYSRLFKKLHNVAPNDYRFSQIARKYKRIASLTKDKIHFV